MLVILFVVVRRRKSGTYGPSTSNRGHNASRNHHRLDTTRTLEEHAAQSTRGNAVGRIMLASCVANRRVKTVVNHRDNTSRVTEERTTASNRVKDCVQSNLRWCCSWRLVQSFCETPRATDGQRGQVCSAGTVAEIVGPAARRQDGAGAGGLIEGGVFEGEVVKSVLVQAGQGMKLGGIDGDLGKKGSGILRGWRIEGLGRLALFAAAEGVPDGHGEGGWEKGKVIIKQHTEGKRRRWPLNHSSTECRRQQKLRSRDGRCRIIVFPALYPKWCATS